MVVMAVQEVLETIYVVKILSGGGSLSYRTACLLAAMLDEIL